jgi:hypothetical protein
MTPLRNVPTLLMSFLSNMRRAVWPPERTSARRDVKTGSGLSGKRTSRTAPAKCYSVAMQFVDDNKLPTDVVRIEYGPERHALGCVECGLEEDFDPRVPGAIGKPLALLLMHKCRTPR